MQKLHKYSVNLTEKKIIAKSTKISPRERIKIGNIRQDHAFISSLKNNSPHYN